MSTNQYFNNFKAVNEQNLAEDLIIESIKIKGIDVYYLPRTLANKDVLYGEDPRSLFQSNKPIEMYIESVDSFEGDGDILSKFGLEVRDSARFVVSKKRFQQETDMLRPLEGDIIYLPMTKGLFEIKFVEHESPFYQLGKNYTFRLSCELFQYSEEVFTTGEQEIDNIIEQIDYFITLTITGGTGSFVVNSTVYQYTDGSITGGLSGADASGLVHEYNGSSLVLKDIKGPWKESSGSITRYVTSEDGTSYKQVTNFSDTIDDNTQDDNAYIEDSGIDVLDLSENNPFGEP